MTPYEKVALANPTIRKGESMVKRAVKIIRAFHESPAQTAQDLRVICGGEPVDAILQDFVSTHLVREEVRAEEFITKEVRVPVYTDGEKVVPRSKQIVNPNDPSVTYNVYIERPKGYWPSSIYVPRQVQVRRKYYIWVG